MTAGASSGDERTAHRNAGEAERKLRSELGENLVGARIAGGGIRDDADLVAARDLSAHKIAT